MSDVELDIYLEETDAQGFNGNSHLNHFLNYLYRTDVEQKNTGEFTARNIALFPGKDGFDVIPFSGLEQRKKIKVLADQFLKRYADSNADRLENDITYFTVHNKDDSDRVIRDVPWLIEQDNTFFVDASQLILDYKGVSSEYLFHVLHIDQEQSEFHIHSVKLK